MEDYEALVERELATYGEIDPDIHDLPPIAATWAERSLLPLLRELGYSTIESMLDGHVAEQCRRCAPGLARLVSLGAGSGETELGIARRLADQGLENLELVLYEINPQQLDRATDEVRRSGLQGRVRTVLADLNEWTALERADVYLANQSLHHIVALERLFAEAKASLDADGVFLVNDMIGRNGHVRWPEAAALVHRIWNSMPQRYRWNRLVKKVDAVYPDPDYSAYAFEGVRAQDVLPLLTEWLYPDVFIAFGNVIDPFVDRVYGWNFSPDVQEDVDVIDAITRLDDAAIDLGIISPTHLLASFRPVPVTVRYPRDRSPARMIRDPAGVPPPVAYSLGDEAVLASRAEELERSAAEARARYEALRRRKAVRAGLGAAALLRFGTRPKSPM